MNGNRTTGLMVSLNGTSLKKLSFFFLLCFFSMFLISGLLTSIKPEYRLSSSSVNSFADNFGNHSFVYLLGYENRYFLQAVPAEIEKPQIANAVFRAATSINPDDPRSLLGGELPGFLAYDGEILIAGDGSNYTNMPMESAPPMEVLLAEREAAVKEVEKLTQEENPVIPPVLTTNGKEVVYIYHTHTRESFLPMLKGITNPDEAYHKEANITLVGEVLSKELEERGIGTNLDKTDFTAIINSDDNLKYSQSYAVSRPVVQSALAANKDIQFVFDLHRDSARKKETTVTINDVAYARTYFVIGGENAKFEKNLKLAEDLHALMEEKYPGLSRGVTTRQGASTDGKFNQDLSENSLVIEFGGVDNTAEELNRTAEAVADVFSEYYWQAEKVNAPTSDKK